METKHYSLESAEGCYSMALMYSRDIKAKYAVKVRCFPNTPHSGGCIGRALVILRDIGWPRKGILADVILQI